jgi:SWI/SNF-related matrix-associated actin-dependent regulator of chromatin subfamily A3
MVESQAISRVFRLGQSGDVKVVRYIVKGTVEEVIISASPYRLPQADNKFLRGCELSNLGS